MIYFKIAYRNIIKHKKQSLLFGISLFFICLFYLFGNALGNGSSTMLSNRFRNFQSGDVVVAWKNIKDISLDDPGRLLFSEIDIETDEENKIALSTLADFIKENNNKIEKVYSPVRSFGTIDSGEYTSYASLYGLNKEELDHLFSTKLISLHEGASLFDFEYAAYLSKEMAEQSNLDIGDWFVFDCPTVYGPINSIYFQVAGIYRNGAPWDNVFVYTAINHARELLAIDSGYFTSARIYLHEREHDKSFAAKLDTRLLQHTNVLRAESYSEVSGFWTTFADFQKNIYMFFSLFLLFVIGMGMRAGVRVTLFQRMQEYGTLRAIGYSKWQNFFIISLETLILSVLSLVAAGIVSTGLILIFNHFGFYVGTFGFEYITGSEYLYPEFLLIDLLSIIIILLLFSLLAPLKPALRLLMQSIPNLLSRNFKPGTYILNRITKVFQNIGKKIKQSRLKNIREPGTGNFIDNR